MNKNMQITITVAVLTYKRHQSLARCLNSLLEQHTSESFVFSILVVDNDKDASARELVETLSESSNIKISYVCEENKNIAAARNRALKETETSLLAFIDDDEYADKKWLSTLFDYYSQNDVDLVNGPVHLSPEEIVDHRLQNYYRDLGYLDRDNNYEIMCTNNCLFNLRKAKELGLEFKEEFGLSGGEDQVFFVEYIEKGAKKIWASKAKVFEDLPEHRRSLRWLLKRNFRYGNSYMRMLKMKKTKKEILIYLLFRFRLLFKETCFYFFYLIFACFYKTKSREYLFSNAFSLGVITACFGYTYYEYK